MEEFDSLLTYQTAWNQIPDAWFFCFILLTSSQSYGNLFLHLSALIDSVVQYCFQAHSIPACKTFYVNV